MVPEVIDPGITGVIVQNIDQAVEAVKHIGTLRRQRCRDTFEKRFTDARMVRDYMTLYRKLKHCDTGDVKDEVRQCK